MGYTTEFFGSVAVVPALNQTEEDYLQAFSESRRMARAKGPYFVEGGISGVGDGPDRIFESNYPPQGQPGLWCKWVPGEDGIVWSGAEKFYDSAAWMEYLIDHFLKPDAVVSDPDEACKPRYYVVQGAYVRPGDHEMVEEEGLTREEYERYFGQFTFDHICNGEIEAIGEDPDDRWLLIVKNNVVTTKQGKIVYE